MTTAIIHHGIGRYWCDNCRTWVWGESGRSYIDIIEVDRSRGTAYTAYYSGTQDENGHMTWEGNLEINLQEIEEDLGYQLREGKLEPWVRMWWPA